MVANVVPPDVTPAPEDLGARSDPPDLQAPHSRLRPSRVGQHVFEHAGLSNRVTYP
jgi:hypothetical protein